MKYKKIVLTLSILFFFIFLFTATYTRWNNSSPEKTCASCHEIGHSVSSFLESAHRELSCSECHGTALSNGLHSLREKASMVFTHFTKTATQRDIWLNESQIIAISSECARCHQSEYKKWLSGGHSATYLEIFPETEELSRQPPSPDCLRCHGMFYDQTINDLLEAQFSEGLWKFKDVEKINQPAVPCMACHQIHTENKPLQVKSTEITRNPVIYLFVRSEKKHIRADKLVKPDIYHKGNMVKTSDDYSQRLCIQCHAPNHLRQAGSSDDRTPVGVHEGLSCNSCHQPHSNDTRNSCVRCHPAISNCNLDVREMNTTYHDPLSLNNIHFVSCNDCHGKE